MTSSSSLNSAIYQGSVRHRRYHAEKKNTLLREFTYQVFMVYLDLQELDTVFKCSRWWSKKRFNLAWFRRKDYFDGQETPLYEAVAALVEVQTGKRPAGSIRMLTNLRYFGFIINPITCYYCFDETGEKIETIVAEVTNTPWKQRCHYVLAIDEEQQQRGAQHVFFTKEMHVSPFQPVGLDYQWYSHNPNDKLAVHIDVNRRVCDKNLPDHKVLDTTMRLKHRNMTPATMQYFIFRYPCMTLKVFGAIYWQALKLFVEKYRFYSNKTESKWIISRNKKINSCHSPLK